MILPESLSAEQRQLLLSQYLDGELEPPMRAAVEERLMDSSEWRRELNELKAADAAAARTVRRFHRDDSMSRKVLAKIRTKKSGAHAAHPAPRHRHAPSIFARAGAFVGNITRAAALVAFGIGTWYGWQYYQAQNANTPGDKPTVVARAEQKSAPGETSVAQNVPPAPTDPTLTQGVKEITGKDGTRILVRDGSRVEFIADRHVTLHGEALFVVAKSDTPFLVDLPGDRRIQVLGTRFDVKASLAQSRIRVAEGHVRYATKGKKFDAYGGTEVAPDLSLKNIDPRQLAADWSTTTANTILTDLTPAWPQAGGSFTHSGTTPQNGPTALVARPEKFVSLDGVILGPAVVDAMGNVYVVAAPNKRSWVLWQLCNRGTGPSWHELIQGDLRLQPTPVVTPEGWVVVSDVDGLTGWDATGRGREMWAAKTKAPVDGLCVTPSSLLVGTVRQQVVAWDTHNGQQKWSTALNAEPTGAITITPGGQICVPAAGNLLFVLNSDGVLQKTHSWNYPIAQPPVVTDSGDLLLQDKDGHVAKLALSSGEVKTVAFKKPVLATPLSSGLFGAGPVLQRLDESVAARPPAPDSVLALAQDGKGQVFVAYKNGVVRLQSTPNGGLKEMEFANIAKGEILPGGIAISPGRVIVTTTQGIQIFE